MADAGFKIKVEGEKEFKDAIREIDAAVKVNKAEMRLLAEQYKAADGDLAAMTESQRVLQDTIAKQGDKVKNLTGLYEATAEAYGENSRQAEAAREKMLNAQTELVKLNAEYEKNNAVIAANSDAQKQLQAALDYSDALTADFAASLKLLDAQIANTGDETGIFAGKTEEGAKKTELLREKSKVLTDAVENQRKKIEALNKKMDEAADLYGEQSKEALNYKKQITDAQTEVENLTQAIDKNNDELKKAENPVSNLGDLFGEIEKTVGIKIPDGIKEMVGGIDLASTYMGGLVAAAKSIVVGTIDATTSGANYGEEVTNIAAQMGVTVEEAQALRYAMQQNGTTIEVLEDVFKDLRASINEALGNTERLPLFEKLGGDLKAVSTDGEAVYAVLKNLNEEELQEVFLQLEAGIVGVDAAMLDADEALKKYGGNTKTYLDDLYGKLTLLGNRSTRESAAETFEQIANAVNDLKKSIYEESRGDTEKLALFERLGVDLETVKTSADEVYASLRTMSEEELQQVFLQMEANVRGLDSAMLDADSALRKYGGNTKKYLDDLYNRLSDGSLGEAAEEEFDRLAIASGLAEETTADTLDVFKQMLEPLRLMADATERNGIMTALMGENSKELNRVIEKGEEGLELYTEQAEKMGAVLSEDTIDALEQTKQGVNALNTAMDSVKTGFQALIAGLTLNNTDLMGDGWETVVGAAKSMGIDGGTIAEGVVDIAFPFVGAIKDAIAIIKTITGKYATGTYHHDGGRALVGEAGPEIVDLPVGTRVYRYGETPETTGGNTYINVEISASDVREFNDIIRIAETARVRERMG